MSLIQPVARIILRVVAGIMIGYGLSDHWTYDLTNDPASLVTLEAVIGGLLWAATEFYYALARKFNWSR